MAGYSGYKWLQSQAQVPVAQPDAAKGFAAVDNVPLEGWAMQGHAEWLEQTVTKDAQGAFYSPGVRYLRGWPQSSEPQSPSKL